MFHQLSLHEEANHSRNYENTSSMAIKHAFRKSFTFLLSFSHPLSFSLLSSFLLSKSCILIEMPFKLLSRCLSLFHSPCLSISCSLCFMWFVVCPKLELFKSHNTEPFTPGKVELGGTKPVSERINQGSRWRRVCAKLQTGATQPRHQAFNQIAIHVLLPNVKNTNHMIMGLLFDHLTTPQ